MRLTKEIRRDILVFLTTKDGFDYIDYIDVKPFTKIEEKRFILLLKYAAKEYLNTISCGLLKQILQDGQVDLNVSNTPLESADLDDLNILIDGIYTKHTIKSDLDFLRSKIVIGLVYGSLKDLFISSAKSINTATTRKTADEINFKFKKIIDKLDFEAKEREESISVFDLDLDLESKQLYQNSVKTGHYLLDQTQEIGAFKAGVYLFIKPAKSGGTKFFTQLAFDVAYGQGKNVWYVDLENGRKRIAKELRMCVSTCRVEDIDTEESRNQWTHFLKSMKLTGGDIRIDSFLGGDYRIKDIENQAKQLKRELAYKPDFIFCDYFVKALKDKRDTNESSRALLQLKKIAVMYDCPIFTYIDDATGGNAVKWLGGNKVANNRNITYDVDGLYAFNRYMPSVNTGKTEDDEKGFRLQFLKGREGEANKGAGIYLFEPDRNFIEPIKDRFKQAEYLHEIENMI